MFWKRKKTKEDFYDDFLKEISKPNEAAEEEKKRILAVIIYLTDGLLIFDKQNKLSLINPQAEKLLNVESEKVIGKQILQLSRFPNIQPLVSLLGGGIKDFSKKELQIKENFILEISSVPMIIKKEQIGSLVILHDISQEKLVERMKSDFVTVAAHQLRTPASAVKWTTKMLLEGDLGDLTKDQKEAVMKAYKTNEKMIILVNDLLNVAQIEEGKYLAKLGLADIEDIIKTVINAYKSKIEQKNIKFIFQKSKEKLPKLMLDAERIKIAVDALIDNAVSYTLAGGRIRVSAKIEGNDIKVQIEDNGLGIPIAEQNKVFSKFFRGSNIMKVDTEGTGLGLFIAKNIIEAHRGKIWFESKQNKSTTFYFTIPMKRRYGEFLTKEFY